MKTSTFRSLALAFGALFSSAAMYAQINYQVAHDTGSDPTQVEVAENAGTDQIGDWTAEDVTAPASSLFVESIAGYNADTRAIVDSTYAPGNYYIGYYDGGSDCYLEIYS